MAKVQIKSERISVFVEYFSFLDKFTHFCPIFSTFVPTIRIVYEDMIEIGLKHTSELTVTDD